MAKQQVIIIKMNKDVSLQAFYHIQSPFGFSDWQKFDFQRLLMNFLFLYITVFHTSNIQKAKAYFYGVLVEY